MHRHFDEQIQEIRQKLVRMGGLAESMISSALKMLIGRDDRHFRDVAEREEQVNALQIEIDDLAVRVTALQQPVGSDVRFLFMAARITSELERIADQAINICQSAEHLLKAPPLKPFVDIPIMADIAQRMVRDSLDALVRKDTAIAERVLTEEDKVDAFRDQIFRELLTYMLADPTTIEPALDLILISRHLERIGDHATNIAEDVIFIISARDVRHHVSDQPR